MRAAYCFPLDLVISGNSMTSRVDTATYRKVTAGNTTLHAAFCHPLHTVKAVPMGELVSVKRNCSTSKSFNIEQATECRCFWECRYSPWMLNRATNKIAHVNRNSFLLNPPHRSHSSVSSQSFVFSTPYSLQFKQVADMTAM